MSHSRVLSVLSVLILTSCIHRPTSQSSGKIVGGAEVDDPSDLTIRSTVALMENGRFFCTGTLIGPNQVLSAAHCISGRNLVLGQGTKPRAIPGIRVISQQKHPRWIKGPYDVSIIIFDGKLPDNLAPVDIAAIDDGSGSQGGMRVTLAGYGVIGESRQGAGILRRVEARIKRFDNANKEFHMQEGLGVGSCYGDSGGPAYVNVGGKLAVIGATSRGSDCDSGDGVYEDVRLYQGWYKCVAKEAGRPLRSLANDESNVDCRAGTIDTDVGPGTPVVHQIQVALSPVELNSVTSRIYFSTEKQVSDDGRMDYCLGGEANCSLGAGTWLASGKLAPTAEKSLFKATDLVSLTDGMTVSLRWTKSDRSQVLERVTVKAK